MEQKEQEIIEKATAQFMQLGIKSLTMDDVARNLGISKKTLYKFVTDKNDLVGKVLDFSCDIENAQVQSICDRGLNAIDESQEISKYILAHIKSMHPSIIFDLKKYHMDCWTGFRNKKEDKIFECYHNNITKGIKEGYYRDNLDPEIIVKFYTSRFDLIFDTDLFPADRFKSSEIYREIFEYHIRGIASEKGVKYLDKKLEKETNANEN